VKVCKDKFTIKRRIPFKLTPQMKQTMDKCTIYAEVDDKEIFTKYTPRDIRSKNGYLQVELPSEQIVTKVQAEIPNVYTRQEWIDSQKEVQKIKEDILKLKMLDQTTEMMHDDDSNFVRISFTKALSKQDLQQLLA
jgi:hypothetical protein